MKGVLIVITILGLFNSCLSKPKIEVDTKNTQTIVELKDTIDTHYKIGVAAMLSPKEALPVYEEIVKYIGEKMGINIRMIFTKDYSTMNEMVKKQKVLAAFVCSGPYVIGHDSWGMELIVTPRIHGETKYYSYILANKDSDIRKFKDLKGKKFAFTDPKSNTGKLVPTYELLKIGKTPENFFSEFIFTGSHDKSIEAVAMKLTDGAAVDNLIWEYMNNTDSTNTSQTRVIEKFGPFCTPPFVTYPNCDSFTIQNLKRILLEMHSDAKGKEILDKLLIDKFVTVDDSCYQSVREMQKWIETQ